MSKEHIFQMESNLKLDNIILDGGEMGKDYEKFFMWFEIPKYRDEVELLVRKYKKQINTYTDFCNFISFVNQLGIKCDTIPKIYYIENNGDRI